MWVKKLVLFLLVLFCLHVSASSEDIQSLDTETMDRQELIETANRLRQLSMTLVTKLKNQIPLSENQSKQLSALKDELQTVNESLMAALTELQNSKNLQTVTQQDLEGVSKSLANLTVRFNDYKKLSEEQIANLETRNKIFIAGGIGVGVLGFVSGFLIAR